MLTVVPSSSVSAPVRATAGVIDRPLKSGQFYELTSDVVMWVYQRRADQEGDAEVGKAGSMRVAKDRVITIAGHNGAVISVVREGKADGIATLTLAER